MIPYINIHTHNHIDNKEIISIQNIDIDNIDNVDVSHFYSIGIHPWNICQQTTDNSQQSLSKLSHILRFSDSQFLKAIGECGLDRTGSGNGSRKMGDFEIQKEIFIKQIELSEQYYKPLIIHAVRTYPDIISIRKETKARQPWIIHGFQGNEQSAKQLLKHSGIYLSLGEVLYKNENRAKRLLEIIPSERLFLETDVAERNIIDVYERAFFLSSIEIEKLRSIFFDTFVKIFGQI